MLSNSKMSAQSTKKKILELERDNVVKVLWGIVMVHEMLGNVMGT